jgi:APA family basic amino acid/polyamine antiporter
MPSAAALVIANMIGAGVFTTSGFALADLGAPEPVLLAWCVGGVLAVCGALSYGALARRFPESGGEYLFLSRTIHPLAGFLGGWVSLLAGFTAPIAAAALGLQAYLADSVGASMRPEWVGTAAIAMAGIMHGLRLREGVWLQNFAVSLKLLLIFGFIGYGALNLPDALPSGSGFSGVRLDVFAVTLVWISFAYSGWNAAVYVAGEVRDPEHNLPRSLITATVTVLLLYLGINAVFLYSAPVDALAGKAEIGAIAAEALGGRGLRQAVTAIVALALFTSISSMVMAGPRVYAKMADDGLFPGLFRSEGEVPRAAIALQTLAAIVVLWTSTLASLFSYIGFTLGISAAATVAGLVALRRREGPERVPIPGYPVIPLVFIVFTLGAAGFMVARQPTQAGWGLVTALLGVPVYLALARSRSSS